MSSQRIVDSHIHLWPEETANENGHSWMAPGHPLAKPHLPADYRKASSQVETPSAPYGAVYIETDVRYETPTRDVAIWAKGPLAEIKFLRDIVEGRYGEHHQDLLLGLVAWAPMDQPTDVLERYLHLAEEIAGPATWKRIKGFRFLLQFIPDKQKFDRLVYSDDFMSNLKTLGRRRFSFDVGVDQRSGGTWQLESFAKAMNLAHKDVKEDDKVAFVVNHLCKPNFSAQVSEFDHWCNAIDSMSRCSKTYVKLSGAFSELPTEFAGAKPAAKHMKPWLTHVLECFGTDRIMFGSDWPVCNIGGPSKENSFMAWREVVQYVLEDKDYGLDTDDKERIWHGTARNAYGLN